MIVCDLCAHPKECSPKEVEGREYDICSECWNTLIQKLTGKGRAKRAPEMVTVPLPTPASPDEPNPPRFPGTPPTIYGNGPVN